MDGVFMEKCIKRVSACFLLAVLVWSGVLLSGRYQLSSALIQLHEVANSDSKEDRSIYFQVRDAVRNSIQSELQNLTDVETAQEYICKMIPLIREIVKSVFEKAGINARSGNTKCGTFFWLN